MITVGCAESVPWAGLQAVEIQREVVEMGHELDVSSERVSNDPFHTVLQYGLSRQADLRRLSLEQMRDMFTHRLMVCRCAAGTGLKSSHIG